MDSFPITPADPRVYELLAAEGFGNDLFNPRQHRSCELVELYVLQTAVELAQHLELREPRTVDELLTAAGFVPGFRLPLRWLLERLALAGLVSGDGERYRVAGALPRAQRERLRAEAIAFDPTYAPAYALVDEAAAIWSRVARGEINGERALFQKPALWVSYFSNTNAYYALNNHVTARAVAGRLPARAANVLELGAGLGSATAALLDLLAGRDELSRIDVYRATEPVAFFRRRAERTVRDAHPSVSLATSALDINRPWGEQDVAADGWDVVWAVNVLHLARDLDATLREARAALRPGGWLVFGEGLRPVPGQPVGAEFAFQLLESFLDVRTDPRTRRSPGFLSAEEWLAALDRAGFAEIALVPDAVRLRALYPGFLAAAICGRRPLDA